MEEERLKLLEISHDSPSWFSCEMVERFSVFTTIEYVILHPTKVSLLKVGKGIL